jgi:hypothetical protein
MFLNKQTRLLKKQCKNRCQLCGQIVDILYLDHDHETEIARGFVCFPCNCHVIPAAEQRPDLVSWKVLQYLNHPPLEEYHILYVNPTPKKPYFGNRSCGSGYWYKEAFYHSHLFASARIQGDLSGSPVIITYYDKKGNIRHICTTQWTNGGEDDLMKFILKNLRKPASLST